MVHSRPIKNDGDAIGSTKFDIIVDFSYSVWGKRGSEVTVFGRVRVTNPTLRDAHTQLVTQALPRRMNIEVPPGFP